MHTYIHTHARTLTAIFSQERAVIVLDKALDTHPGCVSFFSDIVFLTAVQIKLFDFLSDFKSRTVTGI